MNPKVARFVVGLGISILLFVFSSSVQAQVTGATLSGTVTDPSGAIVRDARITVKNLAANQSAETRSDSSGNYSVNNLTPGEYEVSVSAPGFSLKVERVTLAEGAGRIFNISLLTAPPGVEPSLSDLGIPPSAIQGNPQEQARLDKRAHMLKIHQRLGLITTAPLVATVVTGFFAGGRDTSSTDRNVHMVLGSVTTGLYFTTAYYSIFAPRVSGTQSYGPIRVHKALAWIHGPGMILTPILGALAYEQKSRGEKVHGIASAHSAVGIITASAYGAAILSVSLKF